MARWDKILSRGNVQDRRSSTNLALGGGGISITGIALYLLFNYLSGGNIGDALQQLPYTQVQNQAVDTTQFEGADSYEVFASTVLGSTNDMWNNVLAQNNKTYPEPTLVLFRNITQSACGTATSDVGPHYCPIDQTIYIDETFFNELTKRFGARGGDVAEAYVIAHEVGHHVQNLFGTLEAVHSARERDQQELSIKLELQADCYAGLWLYTLKDRNIFEPNEINEAIDAAAAVGDDRIQSSVTGYINPESWTHGSSEERKSWLNRGYETGSVAACNTFE